MISTKAFGFNIFPCFYFIPGSIWWNCYRIYKNLIKYKINLKPAILIPIGATIANGLLLNALIKVSTNNGSTSLRFLDSTGWKTFATGNIISPIFFLSIKLLTFSNIFSFGEDCTFNFFFLTYRKYQLKVSNEWNFINL
jgi:hypothetical protein